MKEQMRKLLDSRADLRDFLYIYGFVFTDYDEINLNEYPFYGKWTEFKVNENYKVYAHPKTKVTIKENNGIKYVLIGHAYDPYNKLHREEDILQKISSLRGNEEYRSTIDGLTGVFVYFAIDGSNVEFEVDATGLQLSCHTMINNNIFIVSHAQIMDDIFELEKCDVVQRLVNYKWYYRIKGTYLPCDLTPFNNVLRVIPDILYKYDGNEIKHKRIFPLEEPNIVKNDKEYMYVINKGAEVLRNSMEMIALKWDKPYISLTGGIDSNTTFSAANGLYDKYGTFTYVSAPKEEIDAKAAKTIADFFGVTHYRFDIPEDENSLVDYKELVHIMKHNSGYVTERFSNEYRKRVYLINNLKNVDIEIKSWSSEAIRGYYQNHFERKRLPRYTPKVCRNLYKLFFANRSLAKAIDKQFESFMKTYEWDLIPESLKYEMFYTEISMGSWGAQNIAEMRMYSELDSVYNNRKFLDAMFKVPIEKRIKSENHLDMKKVLNKELYDLNIRVVNQNETKFRAKMLNLIFNINNWLPF